MQADIIREVKLVDLPVMPPPRSRVSQLDVDDLSRRNQLTAPTGAAVEEIPSPDSDTTPSTPAGESRRMTPLTRQGGGCSLGFQLGTPVLVDVKITTPGSKGLPDSSRFAQGMSDHIPFENLPNAVGTYDKVRGALDRIRSGND